MHIHPLTLIPLHNPHQPRRIQLTIATLSISNLRPLLERKIRPLKLRVHNLLIQTQRLIVPDGAWVREIVYAGLAVLGHRDHQWQQVVQGRVGVGDVDDAGVSCDLATEERGYRSSEMGLRMHRVKALGYLVRRMSSVRDFVKE
jgi:hypothetical protein